MYNKVRLLHEDIWVNERTSWRFIYILLWREHLCLILQIVAEVVIVLVGMHPVHWRYLESRRRRIPTISLWVKVGTMTLITIWPCPTWILFIVLRMILLFLPPMREPTHILILTSISINSYKIPWLPMLTLILCIWKEIRFPSVILPIMSKHAHISGMSIFIIGTPHCLEVEHVEIIISLHLIQHINWDLLFLMCERAEVSVFTGLYFMWIGWTELYFIFLRMVEFFNTIMWSST